MDKNCKKNNCCCDTGGDFIQEKVSDAYLRLINEKQELDDRIVKLKAFIDSFDEFIELVEKVGSCRCYGSLFQPSQYPHRPLERLTNKEETEYAQRPDNQTHGQR